MAFDFLGTFTQGQFDRFAAFVRGQLATVPARIDHLSAELERVGVLAFAYNSDGTPKRFTADPVDSYLGKLLAVYEILGGDAYYDLNLRSAGQPVFLLKGDETGSPQTFSNGDVMGSPGLGDAPSARLIGQARAPFLDTLDYRKEYLERKIRRLLDYSDQLQQEIAVLKVINQSATTTGSLEGLFVQIQNLIADKSYRAITTSTDPFGKKAYAPYAPYDPEGKGATAASIERTFEEGIVSPGSKGGTAV